MRWMYANHPRMAARWQKHTPKGVDLPEKVAGMHDSFMTAFLDELAKLAASQHSLEYEVGKPPRLVDAFEEFKKTREKKSTPVLEPKKSKILASGRPGSVFNRRAQAL